MINMGFFTNWTVSDWLGSQLATVSVEAVSPETVAEQSAIRDIALYTAVGLVADIVCECERQVFKGGNLVRDGNWYRWNISANDNQSASELLTEFIFDIYTKKRGGLIVPLNGKLYVADGFMVDEHPLMNDVYTGISVKTEQINRQFWSSDVYAVSMTDHHGRCVADLINAAFLQYANLLSTASDSYTKSAGEKYVYKEDRMAVGTEEQDLARREQLKSYLSDFISADSAVYPLTKEQDLQRLSAGTSASATTYSDIRSDVYAIVAEVMHLPASLLDGNMNNTAEVVNQALTFAVGPLCDRIGKELTRKTFTAQEIYDGACIRLDTTRIRVRDVVDVADKLDKLIASGIMCIDEARDQCSLAPLNTDWSQAHYLTKNYDDIENPHNHTQLGGEDIEKI